MNEGIAAAIMVAAVTSIRNTILLNDKIFNPICRPKSADSASCAITRQRYNPRVPIAMLTKLTNRASSSIRKNKKDAGAPITLS